MDILFNLYVKPFNDFKIFNNKECDISLNKDNEYRVEKRFLSISALKDYIANIDFSSKDFKEILTTQVNWFISTQLNKAKIVSFINSDLSDVDGTVPKMIFRYEIKVKNIGDFEKDNLFIPAWEIPV